MTPPLNFRTVAYLLGILAAVGIIFWTETYSWREVDEMRGSGAPISQTEVKALHRMLTWSSVVLLATGAVLSVLVYQGLIAPLRRNLEQSQRIIVRQEKLSSLGVLAAGVAHEIRNPLTSIKVRLFTQLGSLEKGTEAYEDNQFISEEISRLETIVSDFLAFARPSEPDFQVVRLTRPLRELVALFRPTWARKRIVLQEEYLADPQVKIDLPQFKQVLINLVQNAGEAIGHDGSITLRTRTTVPMPGQRGVPEAICEVEDTGPGISAEAQQRLFDPFFTTKANGTGLGLSIAARILEKHQGRMEYRTEPGRGAIFRLVLPIANVDGGAS